MPAIMITCPACHTDVPTGMTMDSDGADSATGSGYTFTCPECGTANDWDLEDGHLVTRDASHSDFCSLAAASAEMDISSCAAPPEFSSSDRHRFGVAVCSSLAGSGATSLRTTQLPHRQTPIVAVTMLSVSAVVIITAFWTLTWAVLDTANQLFGD